MSIMSAVGTIAAQVDSILVFHFLGPVELAIYSFASLIPERLGGLFKFVTNAALPRFSTQSRDVLTATIIGKTIRAALAGAAVSIIYIACAPIFFRMFLPSYMGALLYSQLYSLVIITVAANIPAVAIVALRMSRELYIFNFVTPVVLLVLQVPLLLWFGIPGILLARVLSNSLNIVFALILLFHPLPGTRSA